MSERVARHEGVAVPTPHDALPAPSEGVSLASLLERARRRGLLALPPFVSVTLVQRLCRGLQHAHPAQGRGRSDPSSPDPAPALNLESIGVGLDGQVRVTSSGSVEGDVAGAAVVLDRLLGDALDAELVRIIGEVRQPGTTPLGLEQRLGHWLVKQHQLFPRADLVAELVAWLYPREVKARVNEQVGAWLDEQRTGPVLEEKPAPVAASPHRPWLASVVLVVVVVAGTLVAVHLDQPPPPLAPVRLAVVSPSPRPTAPARPESPRPVALPEPSLPRWGEGVPAVVKLSSLIHGVDLDTAGFAVKAPATRWAVKTVSATKGPAPSYASLFVVEFDANHRSTLRQVGTSWVVLTRPEARLFALQTDQPPHDGSFGLAFARADLTELPELRRPNVLTDAMTGLEYRRFVLAGLDPKKRYVVTQQGAAAPVVVTATIPHAVVRDMTGAGFQQLRAPLDQALLQGAPVIVKGASRLSFVVLTTRGAPEQLTSVEVREKEAGVLGKTPPPREDEVLEPVQKLIDEGKAAMASGDFASARTIFQQCAQMDRTALECRQGVTDASAALELQQRKKHAR